MKQHILQTACVTALLLFCTSATLQAEKAKLYSTEYSDDRKACIVCPTFESCSYYVPCDKETECHVQYRKSGEARWNEAFTPYYDKHLLEFRGSLVRLSEDTSYEIQVRLFREGKRPLI